MPVAAMPFDPPTAPVERVHLWLAIYEDGTEGIISADLPIGPGVTRHSPLMSSKHATALRLEGVARQVAREAERQGHKVAEVRMVTFERMASA